MVSVDVDTFLQHYLVAMATSLNKRENMLQTHPSSARNALSHGVKNAKIVAVDAGIFDEIYQFFGNVIPDVHKWAMSTLELLDGISRNFHTIYRHH